MMEAPKTKKISKEKEKASKTASSKKTTIKAEPEKKTVVKKKTEPKTKSKTVENKEEKQITFLQEQFLSILREMFLSGRPISHLLFNGIFRLPNNRLYEFSDEELVRAFSTQLDIMQKKKEREQSQEKKIQKCRDLL